MKNYLITGAGSGIGREITLQLEEKYNNSKFFLVGGRRNDKLEETKNDINFHKAESFPGDLFLNNEELKDVIREILSQENVTVINSAAIMIDPLPIDKRRFLFYAQNSFVDFLSKEVASSGNDLVHISSSNVSLKRAIEKHFLLKYVIRKNIRDFKYRIMKAVQEEIIQKNAGNNSIIIRPGYTNTDFAPLGNFKNESEVFEKYLKNLRLAMMIPPRINMPVQDHIFSAKEIASKIANIISNHNYCKSNNVFEII